MTKDELVKALNQLKGAGSWRELAAELGTTTQTLQNWRSGKYEPRARQMRRLEEVMGDAKAS